jgi:activator of 2-hydroxyglutaryl-CoA dehydratase
MFELLDDGDGFLTLQEFLQVGSMRHSAPQTDRMCTCFMQTMITHLQQARKSDEQLTAAWHSWMYIHVHVQYLP